MRRDYADFVQATGSSPLEYLTADNHETLTATVGRLVELMMEYQPLTDDQCRRMTPEQQAYWAEAQKIAAEFDASEETRVPRPMIRPPGSRSCSQPDDACNRVPSVSEAVAPYRRPETPATRDLAAAEADEALHRDWLHQADGNPTPREDSRRDPLDRATGASGLARAAPSRWISRQNSTPCASCSSKRNRSRVADAALYFRVREVKRRITFKNPVVDFDKVLLVDMPFPDGSEWPHETRHRLGYMAVPGGRLLVLEGLSPDGQLRQLMPQAPLHGSFWRPDLSCDGKKVLFCFKPHNEKSFHLYEINVDGSGLGQLTDGPYDDLDPIYLPDGQHLMFSTTRGHTYVRCMPPTNAFVLARCDRTAGTSTSSRTTTSPTTCPR